PRTRLRSEGSRAGTPSRCAAYSEGARGMSSARWPAPCSMSASVARWRAMRSGKDYVAGLRDGRAVYLDGERIADVTAHAALAEPIRRVADTYDRARTARDDPALTFVDVDTGERYSNMWLIPRSADDLGARRRVHRFWAEPSYGLMGRTPDHVASVITAL